MSDDTTAVDVKWGVDPLELDEFKEAQETLRKARQVADIVPAELTAETVGEAAEALKQLKFAREDVAAAQKKIKAPYDEYGRRVLATGRELLSTNNAAEESLKERVIAFNRAEQKREADERKKAERSERERQERENARAEKENRMSHAVAPSPRPEPTRKTVGTGFAKTTTTKVRKYEIVDEAALPDEYCDRVPNKSKLNAGVRAGLAISGLRVWDDDQVSTR